MKVLITDFVFEKTHKDMNLNLVKSVSLFSHCDVLSINGYYNEVDFANFNNIDLIEKQIIVKTGLLGFRAYSYKLMSLSATIAKSKDYDCVLSLCFDTTVACFSHFLFKKVPLFLFYHRNIDEMTNCLKRWIYKLYSNKVYHIVFEDFFKDRLVNGIGVATSRVFVVPHPVRPIKSVSTDNSYDCIGLCNSNNEWFIQEAVNKDDEFFQKGLHILLRSKTQEKNDGAVKVIKGFIENKAYEDLMDKAKSVFVPLPKTYIFRLSGSIYDALSRGKLVYTTSLYYAKEYERRYPGTCLYVESVDQLLERLMDKKNFDASASFYKFIEEHSIETVSHTIEHMIKTVLEGVNTR